MKIEGGSVGPLSGLSARYRAADWGGRRHRQNYCAAVAAVPGALKRELGRAGEPARLVLKRRVPRHVLQDTSQRGRARALAHREALTPSRSAYHQPVSAAPMNDLLDRLTAARYALIREELELVWSYDD